MDAWSSGIYFLGTFVSLVHALSQAVTNCGPDLECSLKVYCCESSNYFCCDYASFINHTGSNDINNVNEGSFIRMGLKSALVLLILCSAIFLLCFCIMRWIRSSNQVIDAHHGGSLADYRGVRGRMDSLSARLSSHTFRLLNRSLPQTSTGMDDEPPSYSEVFLAGTTPDLRVEIEIDKPPPEYSSVMKEESVAERI